MKRNITTLAMQLGQALAARQWKVATAESCTGGGLAYAMTAVAGSSGWFDEGVVAYANRVKEQALCVDGALLERYGAVSAPVAEAMACGIATRSGAQLAVATSGIAGPGGGTPDKPVGLVWFGFYCHGEVVSRSCLFSGSRELVRDLAIQYALQQLLKICDVGCLDTV